MDNNLKILHKCILQYQVSGTFTVKLLFFRFLNHKSEQKCIVLMLSKTVEAKISSTLRFNQDEQEDCQKALQHSKVRTRTIFFSTTNKLWHKMQFRNRLDIKFLTRCSCPSLQMCWLRIKPNRRHEYVITFSHFVYMCRADSQIKFLCFIQCP